MIRAAERDPNFDFAAALFQIAIVLGSVSIVAASRSLVKFSAILAVTGSLLMIKGISCSSTCRSSKAHVLFGLLGRAARRSSASCALTPERGCYDRRTHRQWQQRTGERAACDDLMIKKT